MKVKLPAEGPDDIVRRVKTDVASWAPKKGPDWADLVTRVEERPFLLLRNYAVAAACLVVILVSAIAVMTAYNVGIGSEPVVTHAMTP
jgi:hypothetical protein